MNAAIVTAETAHNPAQFAQLERRRPDRWARARAVRLSGVAFGGRGWLRRRMEWWDVAGWLGALALLASRWRLNLLRSRLVYLAGAVGLLTCAVALRAWPLAAGFLVLFGIGLWKLWQLQVRRRHRAFQVLEVDPQDEYLRHVLRIHGEDILAHQPGFVWDGAAAGRSAAILQHGPETIGVVLIRTDAGTANEGVAHLELDYVTPRYRNIAPGRFMFLESGFFQARGFQRVVTPPGMRATNYYERLGFRPLADHYDFDLPPLQSVSSRPRD